MLNTEHDEPQNSSLDEKLERALTRERVARFQLWQPLFGGLILLVCVIMFAAAAIKGSEKNADPIAHAARAIVDVPLESYKLFYGAFTHFDPRLTKAQRFKGEAGFHKAADAPATGELIALARFDGDKKRGFVEIMSADDGSVLWTYRPDLKGIYQRTKTPERQSHLRRDHSPSRYLPYHPLPQADGSIIFHSMDSPLVKMDACSAIVWLIDGDFHHGIESDGEGGIWTAQMLKPPSIEHVDKEFQDDAVVHVSADGKILFRRSVSQALIDDGYSAIVYSHDAYDRDPIHMNDVQPALSDGKYWKKGDLFLSLRNPSMIVLYRPSTDKIIWVKQGPWLLQHDVDIVNDHVIAVFDNNAVASPNGEYVLGTNKILEYDFDTDEISSPYEDSFAAEGIRTKTNGLFRILSDGGLFVEEQNFGRLLNFGPEGKLRWTYVNRAPKDGRVYQLGWSRALEGERAERLKRTLSATTCKSRAN